jgi:5-formyltetrahydrofolate cyclo-ligase
MRFYRILSSWNQNTWSTGFFGIVEPPPVNPLKAADFPALIFTPGLAFDKKGNRLGRGKGFYDEFFAELGKKKFKAAGLCMGIQVIPSVPVEKWDHKAAYLCTEGYCSEISDKD